MRILALVFGLFFTLVACAENASEEARFEAGEHYQVLEQPVSTHDPDKIEVVEIFAYTCGHCFNFAPLVSEWKKDLADDVELRHLPAMWNNRMEPFARAYYTARALDVLDQVHQPIFEAIHVERRTLRTAEQWAELFAEQGVDAEEVKETFDSFGVTSQINQANVRARDYRASGTPELVVNGKYRISASMGDGQSHSQMLQVADYLIEKERSEDDG